MVNLILGKASPLDGTNPGSSLLPLEGLLGHSPPGAAFWPSGAVGGQPASGAQIGFWVIRLVSAVTMQLTKTPLNRRDAKDTARQSRNRVY